MVPELTPDWPTRGCSADAPLLLLALAPALLLLLALVREAVLSCHRVLLPLLLPLQLLLGVPLVPRAAAA